jgi:hypothetical protein
MLSVTYPKIWAEDVATDANITTITQIARQIRAIADFTWLPLLRGLPFNPQKGVDKSPSFHCSQDAIIIEMYRPKSNVAGPLVVRAVDLPHPALADFGGHAVMRERTTDEVTHG